jgi:septal ring factor EnvC (AmiA/AmiB activator)
VRDGVQAPGAALLGFSDAFCRGRGRAGAAHHPMRLFSAHHLRLWLLGLAALLSLSALVTAGLIAGPARAGGQSLSQLNAQLGVNESTQSNLRADLSSLNAEITGVEGQIALVRSREQAVEAALAGDRREQAATTLRLSATRRRLAFLRRALAHARTILSDQLVSRYEQPAQSLISVVLDARGFTQLLDQLQFLSNAEHSQQEIIAFTTHARTEADAAAARLAALARRQETITADADLQARALGGMNALLAGREAALTHIESARTSALANAQAQGGRLRSAIATIKAEQAAAAAAAAQAAAAARAAAAAAAAAPSGSPSASANPVSAVPAGGWAIPAAVVMCESGGQNLPPNSAGASGYYQILPSTWTGEGGTGPAAYLAPKSEQDAIAAKLWNNGAGASNWVCAGLVGIS